MIRVDFLMPDNSIRCYTNPELNKDNSGFSIIGDFIAVRDERGIVALFKNVLCACYEPQMEDTFRG